VYRIDADSRSGLDIRIESNIDGRTIRHIYEHLKSYAFEVGDQVETGQVIGWADNTGWSSGDHLHFEVYELVSGKWVLIDPLQEMEMAFAGDILKIKNSIKHLKQQIALFLERFANNLIKGRKSK